MRGAPYRVNADKRPAHCQRPMAVRLGARIGRHGNVRTSPSPQEERVGRGLSLSPTLPRSCLAGAGSRLSFALDQEFHPAPFGETIPRLSYRQTKLILSLYIRDFSK